MKNSLEYYFQQAKKQDRIAQKGLFEMFSRKMLAIAKSYVGNTHDAEDVLMNSFYKAFTKISDCKDGKSFPFWLRKIVVNDSISWIRKNKSVMYIDSNGLEEIASPEIDEQIEEDLDIDEILSEMPIGYKLVFNLYVFEDKKHREIAEILNISEGTSKSQLSKAKKWLSEFLKNNSNAIQSLE